jgi:hypothetical protein
MFWFNPIDRKEVRGNPAIEQMVGKRVYLMGRCLGKPDFREARTNLQAGGVILMSLSVEGE